MNTTWFDKGIEQGIETGRRETIRELLEDRFGTLPVQAEERLQALTTEELKSLRKEILDAASLKDVGLVN
jgi:hypothetical protein